MRVRLAAMCGRFVSSTPADQLAAYFGVDQLGETLVDAASSDGRDGDEEANHNVAPTTNIHTVVERDGVRLLDRFRWGLVPFWAKDMRIGNKMINARAETIATKNAFRKAFQRQRCIIPADGFYEWTVLPGHEKKTPMYIHRPDGEPYAFAGIWDTWRDAEGHRLYSCSIITGEPNEKMAEIHHRMPVMLPPPVWDTWLDRDMRDVDELQQLLVPAPVELIEFHPVSTAVNNPRNKGAQLLERVDPVVDDGSDGS